MKILEWQQDLLNMPEKFVAVWGGYGCAKTHALALFVLKEMLQYPGCKGMVYINTKPQADITVVHTIKKVFDDAGIVYTYNETRKHLVIPQNGSECRIQSLQVPKGELKGVENDFTAMDEADTLMDEWKWKYVKARARGKNGPPREEGDYRRVRVFGNPPSQAHWICQDFRGSSRKDNHASMQISTYKNKFLTKEDIRTYEIDYPKGTDYHRKWMLGHIVALEGAVYPDFNPDIHVVDTVPDKFQCYLHGLDLGSDDPSVLLVAGMDNGGTVWILDEYRSPPMTAVQVQAEAIKDKMVDGWACFSDHSLTMRLAFEHAGIHTTPAEKDRELGHHMVRKRFRGGTLKLKAGACPWLERELGLYKYKTTGKPETTEHKYSHGPDALRYLVVGLDQPSIFQGVSLF